MKEIERRKGKILGAGSLDPFRGYELGKRLISPY